jgi:hypothetical protein
MTGKRLKEVLEDAPDNVFNPIPTISRAVTRSAVEASATASGHPASATCWTPSWSRRGPTWVSAADRARSSERFWRGKGVESEGTGFGLAIVREIMKVHGGTVEVADAARVAALFSRSPSYWPLTRSCTAAALRMLWSDTHMSPRDHVTGIRLHVDKAGRAQPQRLQGPTLI